MAIKYYFLKMKKFKRYVSFNQYFDCLVGQGVFGVAMKAIKSDKTRKHYTAA